MDPVSKAKLDKFKTVIKSIVIPYKYGISLEQIQKDFKELEGTFLPCTTFGYKSPRDFLDSMTDILIREKTLYGEPVYRAKFDGDTVHIQEMVMQQKTSTKRRKKKPIGSYGGYNNYFRGSKYSLRPSTNYWNPPVQRRPITNRPPVHTRPVLPAGFEQNDMDEWGRTPIHKPRPIRHVQITQQPLKTVQVNNTAGLSSNKPPPGPPNHVRATVPFLSAEDVANLKELLKDHGKEGINLNFLKFLYEKKYNQALDPHARGFSDLQHALSTISHICKVELHPSRKFYIVKLLDNPVKKPDTSKMSKSPPKNDPKDSRSGQDTDCDAIIYSPAKVPPEVRQRVDAYHAKTNQATKSEQQKLWSFKLKIMALLMKATDGISINNFSTDFYLNFKESLDPCVYDYKDYSDMFGHLTKELPIQLIKSYSGDDAIVSLRENWQTQWVDICVKNNQYDALKQMIVPDNVVLPGDIILETDVDEDKLDGDTWIDIVLTSVINPNCIFLNLANKYNSEVLTKTMGRMKDFYCKLSPSCRDYDVPFFYLRENFYCTAPFDVDNSWQRVKIVKVEPDRKKVKVSFIDYGGEQYFESSKLRLLLKEFSYLSAQAIRVSLRGIRPKTDKWPSNAKDEVLIFMERAISRKENTLGRLHTRKSPRVKESVRFEAEICSKTTVGYIFLHKQLIESGLAIIDEEAILSSRPNDVEIPSGDLHRPLCKPLPINPKKIISNLRRLQIKNNSESEEPSNSADGWNGQ